MADGLNKAILLGNLGAEPELRYTQGGQAVLRLRMATSEHYKDKGGERQERTEWHTVNVWGKRAEGLNKILAKGSRLLVEGRIETRKWEDKNGVTRYSTEVNAHNVILSDGRRSDDGARQQRQQRGHQGDALGHDDGFDGAGFGDDDIPF